MDARSPLTQKDLTEVDATAVAPALRQNDWAGAAIGAARGYDAVLSGESVPTVAVTPGEADPGQGEQVGVGGGSWLLLFVVLVPVVLVAFALIRRRSRRAAAPRGGEETWGGPSPESLADLDAQARQALTNGLLRQYFPKGTDLSRWAAEDIEAVAATLNSRPRKSLGWKTPAEALNDHLLSIK